MKLEAFFDKFDLLADAPNAVEKMRELALQLAVQGKLVPQDLNDEPAQVGLLRCGVDLSRWKVSEDEKRGSLPTSWMWIRFAGVGEQRLGKMLDAQKNSGVLKKYLRNTNVQWLRFDLEDLKEMRIEEREQQELRLQVGDLLVCEGGEPGRCAIWPYEDTEMYFQKALHRIRPCAAVMSEYLALNLQVDCRNDVLSAFFTGTTIKHLTGRSLSEYPIPIPPLAEQKRIVANVNELMALCDRLEAQRQERQTRHTALARASLARFADAPTPANLNLLFHKSYSISPADLRKSILDLAFTGKLVPQLVSDDEPPVPPPDRESRRWEIEDVITPRIGDLPSSWRLQRIGEVVTQLIGGVSTSKSDYRDDGVLVFNKGNVQAYGRTGFGRDRNFVSKEFFEKHSDRTVVPGDMVVALRDFSVKADFLGLIGKFDQTSPALLSQGACIVRVFPGILGRFLMLFSNSSFYRQVVRENKIGTTQVHLRNGQFGGIPIPLPPLREQCRIVAKVDQLLASVYRLEAQLNASSSTAEKLSAAIVAELTSQVT